MTDDSATPLDDLERQWRESKSTHLGLQLAEEHRRRESLDAAIEVLEESVQNHPRHMSSRVALSRYLVDRERFGPAVEHLLQIVEVDPVHLVANKLLVRSYLGMGRLDEARDKLDIYEMLGEGDADIESLRTVLDGGEVVPSGASAVSDSAQATGADSPLPDPVADGEPGSKSSRPEVDETVEEPFGSGWAAVEAPVLARGAAGDDVFALDDAPVAAEPLRFEPGSEAPPPGASESGDGERPAATAEPERDEEEPSAAVADAGDAASVPAPATVTLGNLYLEQGLTEDAAESFREVLTREPGNRAARAGLEAIESAATGGATLLERKKAVLLAYRARLRANLEASA